MKDEHNKRSAELRFLGGLFATAGSLLVLQILHTRLLSIMSWYFLAFFAISMAMFGMTAGSLVVYFFDERFPPALLMTRLRQLSVGLAGSISLSWLLLLTSLPYSDFGAPFMTALVWLKLIVALALPYAFGGTIIALALTRSPYPVAIVYAVDLLGAAAGCFAVLGLMSALDGVSAVLMVAALAGVAALLFGGPPTHATARPAGRFASRRAALIVTFGAATAALGNAAVYPDGARIMFPKTIEPRSSIDNVFWNSFSRVFVGKSSVGAPPLWGPSPAIQDREEPLEPVEQRHLNIDGGAATSMLRFNGERDELAHLAYDVTNLAYAIRHDGRAGIIGVGGGCDLLSAHYFGFESITGVDINPIFIRNLTDRYADYNRVASLSGVELVVDEARAWFAGHDGSFDLVQMSLIDTWAATGAGAFSLTENGLYTVEAWQHFLDRLARDGVFTVSRWYSPGSPGETGRLVSLAKASLFARGIREPNEHLFLGAAQNLSTLVVGKGPLTQADVRALHDASQRLQFDVLYAPGRLPKNAMLRAVYEAKDVGALYAAADRHPLDISPPTDIRPFFFNQLRFSAIPMLADGGDGVGGVVRGNLVATAVLAIIILMSLVAVIAVVVVPTIPSLRRAPPRLALLGTAHFLLVGLGFMFVEICLMQRLSVFLGHPVYGVAVALSGIILSTGLGSALSERIPLDRESRVAVWAVLTACYLLSVPLWFPEVAHRLAAARIAVRGLASLAMVLPAGVALGFGFPTGMRLVEAIDRRPTPWLVAVNGAAGVLASGAAVAVGTFASINASLWIAAACYLLVWPVARALLAAGHRKPASCEPVMAPLGKAGQ